MFFHIISTQSLASTRRIVVLEELAILFRCPNCDILIAKAHKLRKPVKQNNKRPFIMFKRMCSLHLSRFVLNLSILKFVS